MVKPLSEKEAGMLSAPKVPRPGRLSSSRSSIRSLIILDSKTTSITTQIYKKKLK